MTVRYCLNLLANLAEKLSNREYGANHMAWHEHSIIDTRCCTD